MKHLREYKELFENAQELTQEQRDWLNVCLSPGGNWKFNSSTGKVDVEGNFNCQRQGLIDFKGVRFGEVSGSFYCHGNQLTSLEGAPQRVGVSFNCSDNQLTSLKGAPESVNGYKYDGYFYCSGNQLTSLEGAPEAIGGNFHCFGNRLTSLKGAPRTIGGNFNFDDNQLTSLEGAPQTVYANLYCKDNPISRYTILSVLRMMSDEQITLEQAVSKFWNNIDEEDKSYLAKDNPDLSPEEKRAYEAIKRLKTRVI
jgi:hypothetical protein